jgi:serine/threonine protein kinase
VAPKLLAPEIPADPKFRALFLSESRLAASIDQPNIVPVFEVGGEGQRRDRAREQGLERRLR